MVIRDSVLGRVLFLFTGVTFLLFAIVCGTLGDKVTSQQWVYLMSIPGHKWFWALTFGAGSVAAIVGTLRRRHGVTAFGLFTVGTLNLLTAAFYLLSPLVDRHLMTLGYVIWWFGSMLVYAFAAVNLTPVKWF